MATATINLPEKTAKPVKVLDWRKPQPVTYAIPTWLRDEQIRINNAKVPGRIAPADVRADAIAIVCFGPSLNDTWEKVRDFKYVMTCSGAHKFLIERGIVPTWHVEVDPRQHKVELLGDVHPGVEYLPASACHPKYIDHLLKSTDKVKLWHVFDTAEEGMRILPPTEWALTGGSSVGLRCFTIARFFGFKDFHIFGMDGCEGTTGKHAAAHPNQPKGHSVTIYNGVEYKTTPSLLECARQTFHELDELGTVKATFYGDGLVQAMAKDHKWKHNDDASIAFAKPLLISPDFVRMNRALYQEYPTYGVHAGRHADVVKAWVKAFKTTSVLDYGAGRGYLAKALDFPIWEYDPAVVGKEASPRPADIVICADTLEHVEPDKLEFVLDDLRRCTKMVGYFVIHYGPSGKILSNGQNAHIIQKDEPWWTERIQKYFDIGKIKKVLLLAAEKSVDKTDHYEIRYIVAPKPIKAAKKPTTRRWHVLEKLAKENDWRRGVEVGVKEGFTFLHLLANCPDLELTGVDLFEARPGIEAEGGESFDGADLPGHERRLRATVESQYAGRGHLLKGYSTEQAARFADGSLDFVFIDADHREAAVRADIAAWLPKIKKGGMLCGHDAQDKFLGVLAAINDLCPGWQKHADSVWTWPVQR